MHILIVEDEAFIAKTLTDTLSNAGYRVTCIDDGLTAWQIINQNNNFDLFLLDRQLPSMDGLTLLKKIKQNPKTADIPVVMETGMTDNQSIQEGIEAGAYYYLTKPVHHQLLLSIIKTALEITSNVQQIKSELIDANASLAFLDHACFKVRTLTDAKQLAQQLSRLFPDPQRVFIGLTELLINSIEHGNLGISYQEKTQLVLKGEIYDEIDRRLEDQNYKEKRVTVDIFKNEHEIAVRIKDEGDGFEWQNYMEFSAERAFDPHGRGIAISNKQSFDSLQFEGKGNIVTAKVMTETDALRKVG